MMYLDLAKCAGLAYLNGDVLNVVEIESNDPIKQLDIIRKYLSTDIPTIYIEKFVYFAKSTKTINSLIERIGYIRHTLSKDYTIEEIYPTSHQSKIIRDFELTELVKQQKGKSKRKKAIHSYLCERYNLDFTDNHTDAMSMFYYIEDYLPEKCVILPKENEK